MLKRPQWVKEKIEGREKEIPIQMTIKKKYVMQSPYANMPTMGMTTGSGVDGEVQPGKMVDIQVHEGEGIIPNNAMQGLTRDEFQGLVDTLSKGEIDKNKLREAIKMPTVSEYQTGGVAGEKQNEFQKTLPTIANMAANKTSSIASNYNAAKKSLYPQFDTQKPAVPNEPTTFVNVPKGAVLPTNVPMVPKSFMENVQPVQEPLTAAPVTREKPRDFNIQVKPPEQQTIQTEEVKTTLPETVTEFAPPPPPEDTATEPPPETVTKTGVSPAGEMVHKGLQNILAEMEGVTDTDRKILDFYMQNIDASDAANLRILESRISGDPDMSEQGKQAAIRGLQREAAARRSEQVGKYAISAAEKKSKAARDLITLGENVRAYEEVTKPMSDLEMKQLEQSIGQANYGQIQDMINDGFGFNTINAELAKKGLPPLSPDEFENVFESSSTGDRNWKRDLAFADYLVSVPDPTGKNLAKAAGIYSEKFPGVDVDFSTLLTQQNAALFSQGLSQMGTYVELNMTPDQALDAMKTDGTLEMLGGDEQTALKIYNAARVNSIDEEWREMEESGIYQGMLNSDNPDERQAALDARTFYVQKKMGMLDYDTLHEYKVYGPNNEYKGTVNAKTPEEAQTMANEYGMGSTIEDTGNTHPVIKEPVDSGSQNTERARWEKFKETVPPEVLTDETLYDRWKLWQVNNPNGTYDQFQETETPANRIQALNIGANKELLDTENSKVLWEAYEKDPAALKSSEYYFQYPDKNTIRDAIRSTKKAGENKTYVDDTLNNSFKSAAGKFVELPDGTAGQIVGTIKGPKTYQLTIQTKGGEQVNFLVYSREKGVNYG